MAAGVLGSGQPDHDVVIVGGGHNGLVAAAYLARAGLDVTVLEAQPRFGGAVASAQIFDGVAIKLSRFSYLVSLLPQQIIDDLDLDLDLRSRRVASYTPTDDGGLLVERQHGEATRASFAAGPGSASYEAFSELEADLHRFATVVYAGTRDIFRVGRLLGHARPETTQRYVHLVVDESLWDAVGHAA